MNMYLRFAAMVATSTIVMFGLMYLNTYESSHATYSETRTYMALLMGATMAMIMLAFMTHMLSDRRKNIGIVFGSVLLFSLALWLVRSQTTVEDVSYMRAMIPHHSIAIMTSERARIRDPRVRHLADQIIASQRREIAEMKVLIDSIETHGTRSPKTSAESPNEMLLGPQVPPPDPSAAKVPEGYYVEVVMRGLTYPTSVEFDDDGAMYIAESGYSYGGGSPAPRILRVTKEGQVRAIAEGGSLNGPINDLLWYEGHMYVSHRGKISVLDADGGIRDLITGLPSEGDHHNNQMAVGPDGKIYFGQGTATNSGVVGLDNYKMGWLPNHPVFHDIPAHDIALVSTTFATPDPISGGEEKVQTSSFHPFGRAVTDSVVVPGQIKAGGSILRMNPDGSGLEVYAWGMRNPFGVMWSPDGTLFATENGFDARGSRPIANDQEDIYVVKEGAWYGWPDYAMGLPVTDPRFRAEDKPQPQFVMIKHPPVEKPWLNFPKHAAITKLDFSRSEGFGLGHMYVAFFGHMSPMTGKAPEEHGGHRIVRIDPSTKRVETFFAKYDAHGGHGHGDGSGGHPGGGGQEQYESISAGPRRLVDVRFAPDGNALYVADFGSLVVTDKPRPVPGTGVIWRVVPHAIEVGGPPANLSVPK